LLLQEVAVAEQILLDLTLLEVEAALEVIELMFLEKHLVRTQQRKHPNQ